MVSDEEWIKEFRKQVRSIMDGMVLFGELSDDLIPAMEKRLGDPIKNEKSIRLILNSFGGSVRIGSPRGTNRDDDAVGFGRQVSRSCEDSECKKNHCQQCGQCKAKAGDGHNPWFSAEMPACEPKPTSRKDRQEE